VVISGGQAQGGGTFVQKAPQLQAQEQPYPPVRQAGWDAGAQVAPLAGASAPHAGGGSGAPAAPSASEASPSIGPPSPTPPLPDEPPVEPAPPP
jgi:hypothetical protein